MDGLGMKNSNVLYLVFKTTKLFLKFLKEFFRKNISIFSYNDHKPIISFTRE